MIDLVRPDIVLAIGDEWMIRYMTRKARPYKLVGYVPIDGIPINRNWMNTFAGLDQLVVFGDFGESAIREHAPEFNVVQIPHGVHSEVFRPLPAEDRAKMRAQMWGTDDVFVIGCVARNSPRKQLPRLIKAFRKFINPSTTCGDCGEVIYDTKAVCNCGSMNLFHTEPKKDARLYLHTVHNDPAGDAGATVHDSGTGGLKPAADIDLGVRFAAVVTRAGCVSGFFGPLKDGKLRTIAVDHDPALRVITFFSTDFTSINGADHR